MIDIQSLINDAVEKRSQSRTGKRDSSYFHVSDAGTCYRKRYLKRMGVEPITPIPVGALRKMLAGDAGHEMLQSTLKYYGGLFAQEGEILTNHIKGHFDAVMKDGDTKILLEFKTIEKWGMKYIKEEGAKSEHIIQMLTYWVFLRKDYTNLDQATLFYVKREDFEGLPFNYLWDDDVIQKVQAEWRPLIEFWENKQLPPCTCDKDYGGNGVKYCRYIADDGESCCSESLLNTLEVTSG